ncbi:alpha/beta hydrolase [Nocardia fluminea]
MAAAPVGAAPSVAPTVVLVHGAFADSTSWAKVAEELGAQGISVRAFDNPLRSVAADAAALTAFLASIDGPIVLVGHSYGGSVISNVHDPDVTANVFVSAFAPAEGEILQLLLNPLMYPGSLLLPPAVLITPVQDPVSPIGIGIDGFIPEIFFHQVFAQDVTPAVAADMYAHQKTAALQANLEPSGPPSWVSTPSWYLVSTQDRVIPPALQRMMAGRAAPGRTAEVDSSHAVPVSRPDRVAAVVRDAIAGTS